MLATIPRRSAFRTTPRWPSASAHLHLAVVEVGSAGFVFAVFERLAQQPVQ
ncbi:MAG: hypothetical protein ACR2ML_13085 [Solirubrobacteraceae bacterium]